MKNEKEKFDLLDFIFPVLSVYVCWLCFHAYYIENTPEGTLFDIILLTIISFIFFYGCMAICRDFKMFGIRWMLTSWKNIFKNEK